MELQTALEMARGLVDDHGLGDWTVTHDGAKARAGACRFARREISLSRHLTALHDEAEVRETVLHEIAHALVGPTHQHDQVWRAQALAIGSSGRRCVDVDAPRMPGEWVGSCPAGHVRTRHRRPTRVVTCVVCSPVFDLAHAFDWTHRGHPAPMHPNYLAELAGLRAGRSAPTLRPFVRGELVRVTAPGRYSGAVGRIEKRARTRYHVSIPEGLLTVPFSWVEPVQRSSTQPSPTPNARSREPYIAT